MTETLECAAAQRSQLAGGGDYGHTLSGHPVQSQAQIPAHLQIDGQLGQPAADQGSVAAGPPVLTPGLFAVPDEHLQVATPAVYQPVAKALLCSHSEEGHAPALVDGTEEVGPGHPDVVIEYLAEGGVTGDLGYPPQGDPGALQITQESGDAFVFLHVGVSPGIEDDPVGVA